MKLTSEPLRVTADGVTMIGQRSITERGIIIRPGGFSGFLDGVGVRRQEATRPQGHGSFPARGYRDARLITVAGVLAAAHDRELAQLRHEVTGILADGQLGGIEVEVLGDTYVCSGYLGPDPRVEASAYGGQPWADFQIQFWCPDPRIYGVERVFSGQAGQPIDVFHRGNARARPVVEVAGSMPSGFTVTGPAGEIYTVTTPVVAGAPHVVDMASGRHSIAGVGQASGRSRMGVFELPRGVTRQVRVTGSGAAQVKVRVADTYL